MAEIASAFVTLVPSTRGFGSKLDSQVSGEVAKSGSSIGSAFGSALKVGALGVTAAAGGLLGTALAKGFARLQSIDQATAKLSGLGNSAAQVDKIMGNALSSVRGTAFGLGDAATVAAGAVAAGIKPGRELEGTLKLVADAATIGGSSLSEMGAIFNKVAASNKVQGDVINQLNDQGIPIVQLLGRQLGVTSAEVTALASKGKIDFATFSAAMQSGLGGAALKSGDTFSGALANVGASLSRIGAGLIGGIFPKLAPAFQGVTVALAPLEGVSAKVGDAIGRVLGPALEGLGPFLTRAVGALASLDLSKLSSGSGAFSQIGKSVKELGGALAGVDLGGLGRAFSQGAADTVSVFSVALAFLANNAGLLAKAIPFLIVGFAAFKAAQAANNVLSLVSIPLQAAQIAANLTLASSNRALAAQLSITNAAENVTAFTRIRSTIATVASTVATMAASAAARAFAVAQSLVNAALRANPIGLVVTALTLLGVGLVIAYKKSETFRAIVDGAFSAVRVVVSSVVGFLARFVTQSFGAIADAVRGSVGAIRSVVSAGFGVVRAVVQGVGAFVAGADRFFASFADGVRGQIGGARSAVSSGLDAVRGAVRGVGEFVAGAVSFFDRFAEGVRDKISDAVGFVRGIPAQARAALGSIGSTLTGAGSDLIQGLIDGITGKIGEFKSKLSSLTNLIPKLKGPPKRDAVLLKPAGRLIMEGLIGGIESQEGALVRTLGRVTSTVRDEMAGNLFGGVRSLTPNVAGFDSSLTAGRSGASQAGAGSTYQFYTFDLDGAVRDAQRREAFGGVG